jgi:hypothetical protein
MRRILLSFLRNAGYLLDHLDSKLSVSNKDKKYRIRQTMQRLKMLPRDGSATGLNAGSQPSGTRLGGATASDDGELCDDRSAGA